MVADSRISAEPDESLLYFRPTHLQSFPRLNFRDCQLSPYASRYLFSFIDNYMEELHVAFSLGSSK